MFAFCPNINQKACGISEDESSRDFKLQAVNETKKFVFSSDMRYIEQPTEDGGINRESDACHYLISAYESLQNSTDMQYGGKINIVVQESKAMNIYLYEGPNRLSALKSVTENNEKITASDKTYSLPLHSSFLVVAYPEADIEETSF